MSEAPADDMSRTARLSSYVKTNVVVNGVPVYIGSEMSDEPLDGESFADLSARISVQVANHLAHQIEEATFYVKNRTSR